jgi:RhoGEF domain
LNGAIQSGSEDDSVTSGVATVANEFMAAKAALLELYIPYARGHDSAVKALRNALTRSDVARTIESISTTDERVRGSSLESLLAVPLERLSEYRDLLSALLSLSTPTERGYSTISETVDMFSALVRESISQGYNPGSINLKSLPSPSKLNATSSQPSSAYPTFSTSTRGASTASIVEASMPSTRGTAVAASVPEGALVTAEAVLAAQAEAEDAQRRLEALEREVALKEGELSMAQRELSRAESAKAAGSVSGGTFGPSSASLMGPMDDALRKLQDEERELLSRIQNSENRPLFEAFLARKRELEEEEARLMAALAEHEDTLAQVRARLAHPPSSVLPSDPAKAQLYIAWKRALAEREELLRQARKRKHELLRDLKARHETQVVLLEMERRAAVDGLREAVSSEAAKVEAYKRDMAALDESIENAKAAMKRFRGEFEQLRVALLIDRMAKSSQVANLADRRRRLAKEAESFAEAVENAKARVAAEESAKWEAKLASEREAGEKRVADERRAIEAKIEKVRAALAERYEAGFKPLLQEAEGRHLEELQRIVDLQRELEAKEAELRSANEAAQAVSAALVNISNNGAVQDEDPSANVPEWKLREFEDLRNAVATMWEQLDVPAEDITAFLSECDLLAPYHPKVLEMYQDMYKRLTGVAVANGAGSVASPPRHDYHTSSELLSSTPGAGSIATHQAQAMSSTASTQGRSNVAQAVRSVSNRSTPVQSTGRSTIFGSSSTGKTLSTEDEYAAFLAKKSGALPPSLGGAGSSRNPALRK